MTKNRILATLMVCICCLFHNTGKAAMLSIAPSSNQAEAYAPLLNDPIEYCDTNAYCFQMGQCEDTNCQNAIVLCHQICEATFHTMVSAYGTTAAYLGSYSVGDIRNMLGTLDCKAGDYLSFVVSSGGSIALNPASGAFIPTATNGRYSIAFFMGVLRAYKPGDSDLFRFYKVKDANGTESIGLKLTKDNVDVFFSDVSSMYP